MIEVTLYVPTDGLPKVPSAYPLMCCLGNALLVRFVAHLSTNLLWLI